MTDTRKHIEEKFRCYQQILSRGELVYGEVIDLDEITHAFVVLGMDGELSIRYIPDEGDYVYLTKVCDELENGYVAKLLLEDVGEEKLTELVEIMRKAMIISELRDSFN